MGLVPKKGSFAPAGATDGLNAVQAKPTKLFFARNSVSGHNAAKW